MAKTQTSPEEARAAAEALALHALTFLAGESERLSRFLALSGIGPADLRARVGEPEFLGGVLDHLLSDERLLMAFSKEYEVAPTAAAQARSLLPGAPTPD